MIVPFHSWPFTYGIGLLGGASVLNGIWCNLACRRMLHLGSHAIRTSFILSSLPPLLMTVAGHSTLVALDLLENKMRCLTCVEVRAAVVQACCGVLYPFLSIPVFSLYLAKANYTYRVPDFKNAKELMKLWWLVSKSSKHIYLLLVVNITLAAVIAQQQASLIEKVNANINIRQYSK